MKIKAVLVLGLSLGTIPHTLAATQSTDTLAATLGDFPIGGNALFIAGTQIQTSDNKVVNVDPYTGKPVLHISLIHVPVNTNLSLDLTVTNYQTYQFMWAQSDHNSNYFFDHKLGFNDNIYPGITIAKCGTNRPLFIDPQGNGHLFFASSQTADHCK